jgi:hypothetical protein
MSSIAATTGAMSTEPSPPSTSIARRISRIVSTRRSSTSVVGWSIERRPSRSSTSRFSPAWATRSSCENARNPLVPLIVWIVRKTLAISARDPGSLSSATRS